MPRGDGTGPSGMGPMTGRAAGYCAGFSIPGFANPVGRMGLGRGRGRGRRNMFYATGLTGWQRAAMGGPAFGAPGPYAEAVDPAAADEQELGALKSQAEHLQATLDTINRRIQEMAART